jgi:cell division protein FtsN
MTSRNLRTFEFKLGKRGTILFILGMSLLLFSAYLLGVKVGENIDTYPEKLSRGIPDIVKKDVRSSPDKTKTVTAARGGEEESNFDLTFYDTLARKGDGQKEPVFEEGKEKKLSEEAAKEQPVPGGEAQDKKGHAGEKISPVKGKYIIQAASYREREKADRLCKRLKVLGYNPMVVAADLPGKGKWFRVILGGFETPQEAQKVVDVVSKKIGGMNCIVRSTK